MKLKKQFFNKFWENIDKKTPLYGSDIKGTLFDENDAYPWDLNKIESVLKQNKKRWVE